ncbi:rhamnosyltransferase [Pseudomonas sp. B10]|uniref:glycosyltransferase n=1 Tax=Pseudomonas sp. B10 TaxID=118613 RepID=UPI0009537A64|nr:glycosyltransferase [Pseudomonas sp. B10]SIR32487.1 rhamnosyltransferase [Pseudomonas sp. B10]
MPVQRPKVAVLLAAYNGMQWIEEQLASILSQAAVAVTVYISVDPSTDGTEAWCAVYASQHPQVCVLPPAGTFGGASRNFFRLIRDVEFETFDFVAFADQDDIWHADKLRRATNVIHDRQVDAYSSNVTAFWPDGKTHLLNKAQHQVQWDFLFEAAGPGCTYVLSKPLAEALKTSVLEKWDLLQDVNLHDWYIYSFARSHKYAWYIDPRSSMDYRQHEHNQVGANKGFSPLLARYKTIRDGWWFSQVQLIAQLVGLEGSPFVQTWLDMRRGQLIKLSLSAWRCRRRLRDKVLFFCVCWITALMGNRIQ